MTHSILRTLARGRTALAGGAVACALMAFPDMRGVRADADRVEIGFTVRFEGVGAEGADDIWRGPVGGNAPGEITIRVEYRGEAMRVSDPVWPVGVIAFVAADDPMKSFAAEAEGTLDWSTGAMRVVGRVSDGWMKGALFEGSLRIDPRQLDGAGTLRLDLVVAGR